MISADVDTFKYSRLKHKDRNSDSLMNKVARDMYWWGFHEIDSYCYIGSDDERGKEKFRKKLEAHTRWALGKSYKLGMRNDGSYILKDANRP
jgi:hypothetical protein